MCEEKCVFIFPAFVVVTTTLLVVINKHTYIETNEQTRIQNVEQWGRGGGWKCEWEAIVI